MYNKDLKKQMHRYMTLIVGFQVLSISVVLLLFLSFNYMLKERLANFAQQAVRRSLLAGDLREAIGTLDDLSEGNFIAINYIEQNGKVLFTMPPQSQLLVSKSLPLFSFAKTFALLPRDGNGAAIGRLEFIFSIFDDMGYVLIFSSVLILVFIPITNYYRKKISRRYDYELGARTNAAIAQTTQMLAHDVRKPFSILQMGLEMLGSAKNMSGVKETLNNIAPEVERALASVNGMINDVMDVGRTSALQKESVSPESIIESSLSELSRIYPESDVNFSYDLKHIHMFDVDPLKVGRVFSNIMGNAVQAMKERGNIWIKTTESGGEISVCLGNDGSFISKDDLPKLFEAFYTKNKKGGTGLGLAIAQKVVTSHGGKIRCSSSEQDKTVEFHFTLPIAQDRLNRTTAQLPRSTKQIIEAYNSTMSASNISNDEDNASQASYGTLEQRIVEASRAINRKIAIAIVDDEAVYRNAVMELLDKSEVLNECLIVELFSSSAPLLAAFKNQKYDFLVCDIDLGRDSMDGYEIVKELRESHYDTTICIHSNRSLPEDYAKSVEVGAQAFLPKPMARIHLLKLLCQALEKQVKAMEEGGDKAPVSKPHLFALVDDSKLVRLTWQQFWSVGTLVTFSSPKEFWNHVNINPSFLNDLSGVITDFHFEEGCREDGWDFAKALRSEVLQLPIVLASNGEYKLDDFEDGFFNAIMNKKTPTLQAIKQAFNLK